MKWNSRLQKNFGNKDKLNIPTRELFEEIQ